MWKFASFLCAKAGIVLALCARAGAVSVPFVGCVTSGQVQILEAPRGTSRSVPISFKDAGSLAYYKSAGRIGVLAPRGWYCEGASGSGGDLLFLSPKPIHNGGSGWVGLKGPAITIYHMTADTGSGRVEIAGILARVFPAYRAFAALVMKGMDLPLPASPYPKDTLLYKGKTIVEFNTPAQTEGLGNCDSWMGKNGLPIKGAAIIVDDPPDNGDGPDLVLLSVRVPPALARLTPVIVSQFERDTIGALLK